MGAFRRPGKQEIAELSCACSWRAASQHLRLTPECSWQWRRNLDGARSNILLCRAAACYRLQLAATEMQRNRTFIYLR